MGSEDDITAVNRPTGKQTVLDGTGAGRHVRLCGGLRNRPQPLLHSTTERHEDAAFCHHHHHPPLHARWRRDLALYLPKEDNRHRQDGPNLS